MKIVIFDLDGTLISENSTDAIINAIPANRYKKILHSAKVFLFSKALKKISKRTLHLRFLKSVTFTEVQKACQKVFSQIAYDEKVLELFRKEKKNNKKLILGTSAISPFAELIAQDLGFDACVSCDVTHKANKIIDIKDDIAGAKIDHVKNICGVADLKSVIMISDNKEDFIDKDVSAESVYINRGSRNLELDKFKTVWLPKLKDVQKPLFLLPSAYFIMIRQDFFSLFIYRFPALFIAVWLSTAQDIPYFIPFLFWLVFICVYEIGYLHNDIVSVARENNPSMRLSPVSFKWFVTLVVFRLTCGLSLSMYLASIDISYLWLSLGLMATIVFLFISHNLMPRFLRVSTYTYLKSSHLIVPFLSNNMFVEITFSVLLSYGFIETRKYIQKIKQNQVIAKNLVRLHYFLLPICVMLFDIDLATLITCITMIVFYLTFWNVARK